MAEQQQGDKQYKGVKKFTYRGFQLEELSKMPLDKLVEQFRSRQRRKFKAFQDKPPHSF